MASDIPNTHPAPARNPGGMACGACAHWLRDPNDKMTRHGYGRCPRLPRAQYLAAGATCRLPNRYQEIAK